MSSRWWVVPAAVLIQFSLGAIYAWPAFTPLLREAGWSKLQTQAVFSCGLACFSLSMLLAGPLIDRVGPRLVAVSGGLFLGGGYVLAGLLGGTGFATVLLSVGVLGGIGIGLAYIVPLSVGIRWFPDRKGMITGIAVAGFGFGAMVWVMLAHSWGHLLGRIGIERTFLLYGVLFAASILLGSFRMTFPAGSPFPSEMSATSSRGGTSPKVSFWRIFFSFIFTAGAGLMCIGLMKLFPVEELRRAGFDPVRSGAVAATAAGIFFPLANGLGRILWGFAADRFGARNSVLLMAFLQGAALLTFPQAAGAAVPLYLWTSFVGFNFGGSLALFPLLTAETFGPEAFGRRYPRVFLAYGVGGIAGPLLGGWLGDAGDVRGAFIGAGISCWIAALLIAGRSGSLVRK